MASETGTRDSSVPTPPASFRSPQYKTPFKLVRVDFEKQDEYDEMLMQRNICGWANTTKVMDMWRHWSNSGRRLVYWVTVPKEAIGSTSTDTTATPSAESGSFRAGHITLTSVATPPDDELARADRSILCLGAFFIMPQYRSLGLGRAAIAMVEAEARSIPECHTLTVDAISRRYAEDDSYEWGGRLERMGADRQKGKANEDWYARLGFVKFREEPRYPAGDGEPGMLIGVLMRKKLK